MNLNDWNKTAHAVESVVLFLTVRLSISGSVSDSFACPSAIDAWRELGAVHRKGALTSSFALLTFIDVSVSVAVHTVRVRLWSVYQAGFHIVVS
jgi:hypothetical protein